MQKRVPTKQYWNVIETNVKTHGKRTVKLAMPEQSAKSYIRQLQKSQKQAGITGLVYTLTRYKRV